jgi:predicted nucleotidyltransferase
MDIEKLLQQFSKRAQETLGPKLHSVVLYGSAATGEFDPGRSDVNLLVLVKPLDFEALQDARPLLNWWLEQGCSWPLLLEVDEFLRSGDAFPMELTDIFATHRTLYGDFTLEAPQIDSALHRAQLEHELRSKLLRLRQKAIALLDQPKELLRLLENSVPTFLLLLRHTLLLAGHGAGFDRRANLRLAEQHFGLKIEPFLTILDTRQGKVSPKTVDSVQLFQSYLAQVQVLVHLADRLSEPRP